MSDERSLTALDTLTPLRLAGTFACSDSSLRSTPVKDRYVPKYSTLGTAPTCVVEVEHAQAGLHRALIFGEEGPGLVRRDETRRRHRRANRRHPPLLLQSDVSPRLQRPAAVVNATAHSEAAARKLVRILQPARKTVGHRPPCALECCCNVPPALDAEQQASHPPCELAALAHPQRQGFGEVVRRWQHADCRLGDRQRRPLLERRLARSCRSVQHQPIRGQLLRRHLPLRGCCAHVKTTAVMWMSNRSARLAKTKCMPQTREQFWEHSKEGSCMTVPYSFRRRLMSS